MCKVWLFLELLEVSMAAGKFRRSGSITQWLGGGKGDFQKRWPMTSTTKMRRDLYSIETTSI